MKSINLHLVSDSTGETVGSVARAALVQFDALEAEEYTWPLIRSKIQMERVLTSIRQHPGAVLFTMVDQELIEILRNCCKELKLPCIPVLKPVVEELSVYLGEETHARIGKQHELTEEYFARVEAINYTLAHDDGQAHWELEEADIVVVGISRTSKSPTCVFLAYKGFKAANIPFVLDCPLPAGLTELKKPLVVGLTIHTKRLEDIRRTRLQSIHQDTDTNYVDVEYMEREIEESRKLFRSQRWPIIDVTRRSVEETAANIIQLYRQHLEKHDGTKNS